MAVAAGPHELARLHTDLLRNQVGQQRVRGDVEGHAQEHVRATLVQLAGQLLHTVRAFVHVELEECVAGRKRHIVHLGRVPRRHNMTARARVILQRLNNLRNLVNRAAIGGRPRTPLHAVHRTQIAVLISPLIPNGHAALLQPAYIRGTAQEPQQLNGNRLEVHALGGNQRERLTQVKTHLTAKHTEGAGAGTVGTLRIRRDGVLVLLEDFAQKIFIGSRDCVSHKKNLESCQ